MDIREEINKHLVWMDHVVSLLGSGETEPQTLQDITAHDHCALGQWLESDETAEFADLPQLDKLRESHSAFHRLAGELIAAVQAGDETKAIQSQVDFMNHSQQVIAYLQVLQQAADDAEDH